MISCPILIMKVKMKKVEMMCQRYLLRISLWAVGLSQRPELLVWSLSSTSSASLSQRGLNQGGNNGQPKVIPTPTMLLFQRRLPLIGTQDIPPWQLHSCLLCLAPPGSKSREAEVLLVLKAEQYPDSVWPRLAKACNIYHRRERESFNASVRQ